MTAAPGTINLRCNRCAAVHYDLPGAIWTCWKCGVIHGTVVVNEADLRALLDDNELTTEAAQIAYGRLRLATGTEPLFIPATGNRLVCSACRTEACFAGTLMCDDARTAGVIEVQVEGAEG